MRQLNAALTRRYELFFIRVLVLYDFFDKLIVTARSKSFDYVGHLRINKPTMDQRNVEKIKHNAFWCVLEVMHSAPEKNSPIGLFMYSVLE